eukprot:scaffold800_cov327-Pavlova_lutheri.AAC.15
MDRYIRRKRSYARCERTGRRARDSPTEPGRNPKSTTKPAGMSTIHASHTQKVGTLNVRNDPSVPQC